MKKCKNVKYTPQTIYLFLWKLGLLSIMILF